MNSNGQVIWLMGLSGAGKTTLAQALRERIPAPTLHLDGDEIRQVQASLITGYEWEDRLRLARASCRLAKLAADQGLTVICSMMLMFHEMQRWNRENIPRYLEVFLDMPADVLQSRDYKQVYRAGSGPVVGRDLAPQRPQNPDLVISDPGLSPDEAARLILSALQTKEN